MGHFSVETALLPGQLSAGINTHMLAPFDTGLCITAAEVLLRQDKAAEARTALKSVAYNPHAGAAGKAASATVAAIDKDGAKGGLALLDTARKAAEDGASTPPASK